MPALIVILLFLPLCAVADDVQNPAQWQQLHQQGTELEKAGNYSQAIAKYEQSLKSAEESKDNAAAAKSLIGIGRIRTKLGEYAEAMKLIQQGRVLSEQINDSSAVVSALVAISELHERESRFQEALQSAQQALAIAQESKDKQSLSAAYRSVGHCYYYEGKFNIALENYQESLKYAEETKNPSELCRSLLAMGVAVLDTGVLDKGIQYLLLALENAEKAGERPMVMSVLSETGIGYKEMGMYEESAEYYNRSLRAAEEIGQKEAKARILNNLGVLNAIEGRNDESIYYYHQSLKIAEELKNKKGIALLLNNIGNILRSEGRLEEALSYYERSLKTREEIGDQWGIASALMNVGVIFEKQKQYNKAVYVYQRSLKISEQTGNKSRVALASRHLAEAFLSLGNYEMAEENYDKTSSLAKETHSKIIAGYSLEGYGKVNLGLGKYSEAAGYFQQALTLSKEINQPEMIWRSSSGLAKANEKLGRNTEALGFYFEAIDEIEKVRARASSDEGKSGFLTNHLPVYEDMISFLYTLDRKHSSQNYDVIAFDYSERAKARMFLDTLTEFQSGIRKGLSKEQVRQEKVILQRTSKLQSEVWDGATDVDQIEKQKKLLEAERELDQFILNLKLRNPQYAQLKYPEPYGAVQIQKHLDEKTVLLEFFLGEKNSFVFAVTANGIQMEILSGGLVIEEAVRKYLEGIRTPSKTSLGKDPKSVQQIYRQQANTLFQLLLSPVQQRLKGKEHLILILDGILHYVPFETLITDEDRLLIQDFRIAYAPSATIWATLQKKPEGRNSKEVIAFADPVPSSGLSSKDGNFQNGRLDNLVRLQYSKEEVEGIASLYPKHLREVYVANDANESKFRDNKISQFEVLHFATHALIDEEVPRRSGIVLTPETDNASDGILQMHEIWNLSLNTKLVVLSACDTGLGKLVSGEGMISMMRSFFYAGTKSVVVSLWKVDDHSTADLMKEFYVQMNGGKNPAESLRQAKLNIIQKAKSGSSYAAYEQPYYWAPFILVGPGN